MDINKNKTFKFVSIDKDNNYFDLSYEINDIDINDIDINQEDDCINFSIDKLYIHYISI